MVYETSPLVKVVPELQSRPNMAQISPAFASSMSSSSFACTFTSLGTYRRRSIAKHLQMYMQWTYSHTTPIRCIQYRIALLECPCDYQLHVQKRQRDRERYLGRCE